MIEPVSPADFAAAVGELCEAYEDTFSGPPWNESGPQTAAFAQGVPRWAAREGFQAFWVRQNAILIGFAFRVRTPRPVPAEGFYALLRERFGDRVETGQQVSQGQLIAYSGTTGNSTGCHSHFETWVNGRAVDPMGLL